MRVFNAQQNGVGDKQFIPFVKGISPKVSVIARLEFELFYFDTVLQHVNHYATKTTVIYWPTTEPSIKRCTCVNKWKNSGSRWTLENNITRCPDGLRQSETGCQRENQLADWGLCGPQWPTVEQPRWGRSAAMVERRTWVNIAVCPCLRLISHTQQTSPFRE